MRKIENYKEKIYNSLYFFFFCFSILLIFAFLVNSIDYFQLFLRSLIFSLIYLGLIFLNEKLKKYFPIKAFLIFVFLILFVYFFSSFENLKNLDVILGINNFTDSIFSGKVKISYLISNPLIYERYKTVEESFNEKLNEFNKSIEYLELKIHEEVNRVRAKNNLSILIFDNKLREIARYHSEDMAKNNYFDHINLKGESLEDRFKKFNYNCKISVKNYVYSGAENLFFGYIYKGYKYEKIGGKILSYEFISLEEFVKDVVNSWLDSDEHRKNLLFPHWKNEGIGIYVSNKGEVYVTQVFC